MNVEVVEVVLKGDWIVSEVFGEWKKVEVVEEE